MRSNNPILSRPDAFTPGTQAGTTTGYYNPNVPQGQWQGYPNQGYQQGGYQDAYQAGYLQAGYQQAYAGAQPAYPADRMTIDDVLIKSVILTAILLLSGVVTALFTPINLLYPVAIIGSIVVAVTVWIVALRRNVSVPLVFAYAIIEGIAIGSWSAILNFMYPGIVMQAVLATVLTAFVVFGCYKFLGVRVQGKVAQIMVAATLGYAVFALINLVLVLFNINLGFFGMGAGAGPLSWLTAGIGVVLAAGSLLMDFDAIEHGVRIGAPAQESWRAAFGLLVTLVWLYTLLLRILSFFRSN